MKTLKNYCKLAGLKLAKVRYTHKASGQQQKRIGFDILKGDNILCSFEPYDGDYCPNRNKWIVKYYSGKYEMIYCKRITKKIVGNITITQKPTGYLNLKPKLVTV